MTLELTALGIAHKTRGPLFAPLTLCVAKGEIATIMGPSGVGKSTLLDAVAGHLDRAFTMSGTVRLDGRDMSPFPPEARRMGVLFQDALMFPHLSVGDNLAFGLPPGRRDRPARIAAALKAAGLDGFEARDPALLSGGQKARVALMRCLLSEPRALLLDEPFSSLDASLRARTRDFVFDRAREQAIPVLLVTHDAGDAEAAGGPVHTLSAA